MHETEGRNEASSPQPGSGAGAASQEQKRENPFPILIEPVHVCVPGRARFYIGGLRGSAALRDLLERGLREAPGVLRAAAGLRTGNVVVEYDPGAIALERVVARMAALLRREIGVSAEEGASFAGASGLVWHRAVHQEVAAALETSLASGLSQREADRRLAREGRNALPAMGARSSLSILAAQFETMPVALLLGATAISAVTGALLEAGAILVVVALNGAIGYATESRAERTIESLGLPGVGAAEVIRDGERREVAAETLVPGDLLVLERGMVVPADARILASQRLTVSESALTGESLPVLKSPDVIDRAAVPLGDRANMVYRGTIVTGGSGSAVVVATGVHTEVGRIQRLVGATLTPQTPSQRQLDQLGRQVVWLSVGVSGLIFGVGLLRGYALFQLVKSALSVAVAAVPEGLPMVATTTLAFGVEGMRKRQVLVRRLDAVETLAAVGVVCFDKTGTLTFNRMAVAAVAFGDGVFRLENGVLAGEDGAVRTPRDDDRLRRLYEIGALCSETEIEQGDGAPVLIGSPTENALVQAALDAGLDVGALRAGSEGVAVQHRTDAYRFMATTHRTAGGLLLAVKGGPAEVLGMCRWEAMSDNRRRALTPKRRAEIERANAAMAQEALRVLGFAYREVGAAHPQAPAVAAEDLTWAGLVGMEDPVRPGLAALMRALHRAGLRTVMLTGDQSATARAVGEALGLSEDGPLEVVDAADLDGLDADALARAAGRAHAFARISPAQKLDIVRALQRSGAVVAMIGDGINDSPALRAADVGIAMGQDGTSAAREVADVFLETDDLHALVTAIERGRTTYTNVRKAIRYLLGTNLSEVLLVLAGSAMGLGEALSPMQLLWINLISDVLPGIGLAMEPPEPDIMDRGPQPSDRPILRREDFATLAREGATLGAGALAAGLYGAARHGAGSAQARSMMFGSLVSAQLLHAITCRSGSYSVLGGSEKPLPNRALSGILIGSALAQSAALFIPGVRGLLGVTPIAGTDLLVTLAGGTLPFLAAELRKGGEEGPAPRLTFRRPSPAQTGAPADQRG